MPEIAIMNAKTFSLIRKSESTVKIIKPLAASGTTVTKAEVEAYILDNYGVTVLLENGTYRNDKGEISKFYPDGHLTLVPNGSLGSTVSVQLQKSQICSLGTLQELKLKWLTKVLQLQLLKQLIQSTYKPKYR